LGLANRTCLYDFKLEWAPESGEPIGKDQPDGLAEKAASTPDASGRSIFTAVQEQLGLKLGDPVRAAKSSNQLGYPEQSAGGHARSPVQRWQRQGKTGAAY
jgi:hypothetical protein